jgi:hypothetical protein
MTSWSRSARRDGRPSRRGPAAGTCSASPRGAGAALRGHRGLRGRGPGRPVAAAQHWAKEGVPSNPRSWLLTTASRAVVDEWRSVRARRRLEETVAALEPPDRSPRSGQDDSLALLLMCCHPVLPVPSQIALTLRAVGGLTTTEIARAFLVPEATMAKGHHRKLRGEQERAAQADVQHPNGERDVPGPCRHSAQQGWGVPRCGRSRGGGDVIEARE